MKVNELRVGNLIQWRSTGNIEEVKDIVTYDKKQASINNVNISDCLSIPLTEEWLLKLGFEKSGIGYTNDPLGLGGFTIYLPDVVYPNGKVIWNCWTILDAMPSSVHSLQNLYCALTGEELTLNNPKH